MLSLDLNRIWTAEERFELDYAPGQLAAEVGSRVAARVSLAFHIFNDKQQFRRDRHAESKTPTLEDADGQAPHARRAEARGSQRVPPLPRAEGAASRLRQLRLLPRPPGARR